MKKKRPIKKTPTNAKRKYTYFVKKVRMFMGPYSIMLRKASILVLLFSFGVVTGISSSRWFVSDHTRITSSNANDRYWFLLKRSQNIEYLFYGAPQDMTNSKLLKTFFVKTGIPGIRPTPLPQHIGKEFWLVTDKYPSDNPETAPYFLELNVPGVDTDPYGPVPYTECNGQCNWIVPGSFGLHGVNGDLTRLGTDDEGSSGCVRHNDTDITFLYQLLEPKKDEIRYYIQDL